MEGRSEEVRGGKGGEGKENELVCEIRSHSLFSLPKRVSLELHHWLCMRPPKGWPGVPVSLIYDSVCHLFGWGEMSLSEKKKELKVNCPCPKLSRFFLPNSVGCRCFKRRLSPIFGAMSLVACTPWKAFWMVHVKSVHYIARLNLCIVMLLACKYKNNIRKVCFPSWWICNGLVVTRYKVYIVLKYIICL